MIHGQLAENIEQDSSKDVEPVRWGYYELRGYCEHFFRKNLSVKFRQIFNCLICSKYLVAVC